MSYDTTARINFTINKTKHAKVFDALRYWKHEEHANISDKTCKAIEELFDREQKDRLAYSSNKPQVMGSLANCVISNNDNAAAAVTAVATGKWPADELDIAEQKLLSRLSKKSKEEAHTFYHMPQHIKPLNELHCFYGFYLKKEFVKIKGLQHQCRMCFNQFEAMEEYEKRSGNPWQSHADPRETSELTTYELKQLQEQKRILYEKYGIKLTTLDDTPENPDVEIKKREEEYARKAEEYENAKTERKGQETTNQITEP